MIESKSSTIHGFAYEASSRTLRIKFRSGDEWDYRGVGPDAFEHFQAAESHGKHFHAHIRPKHEAVSVAKQVLTPEQQAAQDADTMAQLRDM